MIILTEEILLQGSTTGQGGWNAKQLSLLGLTYPGAKGWKKTVIGNSYPEETIETFLALKGRKKPVQSRLPKSEKTKNKELKKSILTLSKMEKLMSKAKARCTDYDYIVSNAFLKSYEWSQARYSAIVASKGKCVCCGKSPEHGIYLCVDHIKPRRLFPELALKLNNLQVLCNECNQGKGNWNTMDWR